MGHSKEHIRHKYKNVKSVFEMNRRYNEQNND